MPARHVPLTHLNHPIVALTMPVLPSVPPGNERPECVLRGWSRIDSADPADNERSRV